MTSMMKRDTAKQPAAFGSVIDQIFQNNLSRFFDDSYWGSNGIAGRSVPVNIRETEKTYEMELVAPGLQKEDFQMNVAADTLTVSFEHKEENKESKDDWLRQEYKKQSFTRSFTLDDTVDAGNISARYEGGVLHVTLPKKENAQKVSRTIEIQ